MGERLTKDSIIRALLDASFFYSTGATSLKDISDKLGIKKASLYNHFESRDDLIKHTIISCAEYVKAISFIPKDIDAVAKKYSAEVVLKAIVNRYLKMHEKKPLFQIYTFIESQKYFSAEVRDIVKLQTERLTSQTIIAFKALRNANKINIPQEKIKGVAQWFACGTQELLNEYLLERKSIIAKYPDSGEGLLFAPPPDGNALSIADSYIENFAALLKG